MRSEKIVLAKTNGRYERDEPMARAYEVDHEVCVSSQNAVDIILLLRMISLVLIWKVKLRWKI